MTGVVFVLGSGHSGSTLLDLLLGGSPGFCSTGELVERPRIYERSDPEERCTCGDPVVTCAFWEAVRAEVPETGSTGALIERISTVADARWVIDSSKRPWRLAELVRTGLDVRVIHLVRDGRAVARSGDKWGRPFPELAMRWVWTQLESRRAIRRTGARSITVRYEDLARAPETELRRIADELLDGELVVDAWRQPSAGRTHMLAGNRMRFDGVPTVRFDDRFLHELSPAQWWYGSLIAGPGLRTFGYPIRRKDYLTHV